MSKCHQCKLSMQKVHQFVIPIYVFNFIRFLFLPVEFDLIGRPFILYTSLRSNITSKLWLIFLNFPELSMISYKCYNIMSV